MTLRDYQQIALDQLQQLWDDGHTRQTLVLPCGTGKTVVAAALITSRTPPLTVMLVPTVHLLSQTVDRLSAGGVQTRFLAVCSPARLSADAIPPTLESLEGVDDDRSEAEIATAAGESVTTQPETIAAAIRSPGPIVIVGTYASSPAIAEALHATRAADLLICDEAHHTAGFITKSWARPLHNTLFPATRRLFMTATTRIVQPPAEFDDTADTTEYTVASMDDVDTYGPQVAPMSFRAAIEAGYLSDYQIAVVAIADHAAADAVSAAHARGDNIDALGAAAQLALLRHLDKHPSLRSILVFHNTIADSWQWCRQMRAVASGTSRQLRIDHVDGGSAQPHRTAALNALADPDRVSIVSNCKLFAEGVDVPALDAVMFAGPRSSTPDIVQIVGRAIRPHPSGPSHKALIVIPVIERPGDHASIDVKVARTSFLAAWQVLTTLAEEDDYINNALLQWRNTIDTNDEPDERVLTRVTIDTSLLDNVRAEDFRLKLVRRTTSHYILTAQKLQVFANSPGGHSNPRPAYQSPDGYPLGRRVRDVKAAYRAGRLPPRIVDLYERIGGFTWTSSRVRPTRTADDWIALITAHTAATGIKTVHEWEQTRDPATGQDAPIGKWLHTKATTPSTLTDEQRERLSQVTVIPRRRR